MNQIKRPERVLQKGEQQQAICKCGGTATARYGETSAPCPKCGATINWGLRK